ncbi:heat shock 70 kDa protein 12B [Platysternon megacephalum]|uniref:Heat shock 70 kDa protein 12B n=1 Tax=Platysternon megacephalum TaxID=55544 RepID=A0A4D9E5C0_9SAUR|nr:heat shock 70 kDa protein 12B [Platysternon megacephalum]
MIGGQKPTRKLSPEVLCVTCMCETLRQGHTGKPGRSISLPCCRTTCANNAKLYRYRTVPATQTMVSSLWLPWAKSLSPYSGKPFSGPNLEHPNLRVMVSGPRDAQ